MATEAATGQPANVQAYLSKHSIATLFEDLTALLVKDLPDNPIDFLILKLQAKKKKTTTGTSRTSSGGLTGPKKLDVAGTAAPKTERGKPPGKPTTVKSTSATTTTKPSRPTSTGGTTSRPSTGASTKPTATRERPTATKSAPTGVTKSSAKPTTVKPAASSGIKKPTGIAKPTTTGTTTKTTSVTPRKPTGKGGIPTKTTPSTKSSGIKTPSSTSSNSPSIARKAAKPTVTETPPTSTTQTIAKSTVSSKNEEEKEKEEEEEEEMSTLTKAPLYNDSEESEDDEEQEDQNKDTTVELNQLISQLKKSKHPRKQTQDKTHLAVLINAQSGPTVSEGYISDNEEDESDAEELEVVESIDALEEEGVYLTGEARRMSLKLPSVGPSIDLQVQICARCAKVISRDEESTTVSSSVVSKLTSIDEFESASQVAATTSQSSYPQWDTEEYGSMTVKQKWAAAPIASDRSTSISSTSHDTWKGLAPVSRGDAPSDEESELNLPPPVDYHKPVEDTTEAEESSLIED